MPSGLLELNEGRASARTLLKKTFPEKVFFKVVIKVFLKDPFPYVEVTGEGLEASIIWPQQKRDVLPRPEQNRGRDPAPG